VCADCGISYATRSDLARAERVLEERRTTSQAFFSTRASQWDRVRTELYGMGADVAPFAALLAPTLVVGDLGCGTGQTTNALAPYVARVIAVDESTAMLSAARKRLAAHDNVELRAGRLEGLPIGDATLDAAVISLVLHFVVDPLAVLREAAGHEREEYRSTMGHVWLGFDPVQLAGWLDEAGFGPARVVPLPPDPAAKGPTLFTARAARTVDQPVGRSVTAMREDERPTSRSLE
jgi:SAM-dependent methyltransferase